MLFSYWILLFPGGVPRTHTYIHHTYCIHLYITIYNPKCLKLSRWVFLFSFLEPPDSSCLKTLTRVKTHSCRLVSPPGDDLIQMGEAGSPGEEQEIHKERLAAVDMGRTDFKLLIQLTYEVSV